MNDDYEILEANGWTVECESPFEIRHEDGSFATLQAARSVLAELKDELRAPDPDKLGLTICIMEPNMQGRSSTTCLNSDEWLEKHGLEEEVLGNVKILRYEAGQNYQLIVTRANTPDAGQYLGDFRGLHLATIPIAFEGEAEAWDTAIRLCQAFLAPR